MYVLAPVFLVFGKTGCPQIDSSWQPVMRVILNCFCKSLRHREAAMVFEHFCPEGLDDGCVVFAGFLRKADQPPRKSLKQVNS